MRACETCGVALRERKKGEAIKNWEALRFCSPACKGAARAVTWTLDEILSRASVSPSGCWLWLQRINRGGYATACIKRVVMDMHRVAYTLAHGPIPAGMHVDHACHSRDISCAGGDSCPHRRCVNPDHLEAVTPSENARRGRCVNRLLCRNGLHSMTAENTYCPPEGGSRCRACMRDRQRAYRARIQEAS